MAADLTPAQRRIVWNAVVNSSIDGPEPSAEAVSLLCEFVAGAIAGDDYLARVLTRHGVNSSAGRQDRGE